MSKTADVAAYFCEHYPHKSELSKTRLTKLVYLADWESAKKMGRQVTNIKWYFHNYGPYVDDVMEAVREDVRFDVVNARNLYGESKTEVRLSEKQSKASSLSIDEKEILNDVISATSSMYWNSFIKHVYSTTPIERSDRYSQLNLTQFAALDSRSKGGVEAC